MGKLRLTDIGGQRVLDIAFGDASKVVNMSLKLFTDAGALTDGQAARVFLGQSVTGGATSEPGVTVNGVAGTAGDLAVTGSATGLTAGSTGVPYIQWMDMVWVFAGALTTPNKTIKGVSVLFGSEIIAEMLLDTPYTPAASGDTLTITPKILLGNVPGYTTDPV